jgi:hypothetical protein
MPENLSVFVSRTEHYHFLQNLTEKMAGGNDDELCLMVESLIGSRKLPFSGAIYIFRLLMVQKRKRLLSLLCLLFRKKVFNNKKLFELECKWVWARGFRESALELTSSGIALFGNESLRFLFSAMSDAVSEETPQERKIRFEHISELPSDEDLSMINGVSSCKGEGKFC